MLLAALLVVALATQAPLVEPPTPVQTPAQTLVPAAAQPPTPPPEPTPAAPPSPVVDRVSVLIPVDAAELLDQGGTQGRMLLFFKREGARVRGAAPAEAPFFGDPQPMYGRSVAQLVPGEPIIFDESTTAFPAPFEALGGRFEVQAVFDRDRTERGHMVAGNLVSEIATVELDPEREDTISITLTRRLPAADALTNDRGVIWEELRSEQLTRALGRKVIMRAGVVLPRGYHDINWPRREWPAIYVVPGFGGRHTMAKHYAALVAAEGTRFVAPQAIWVVLDSESSLGHHLFADSDVHGARARALAEEFIPYLESKYRLVSRPEARIVTGHSSGGWSALWLALDRPETFGACFASAPDPVDFSAFQVSNLYRDESIFVDAEGHARGSFRRTIGPEFERVLMTAAEETAMERVLDPDGNSGQQWDAWGSIFGRIDASGMRAKPMFDPVTGAIDREVVERDWSRYDIARRIDREWAKLGPIVLERVRVLCGDRDDFYLDRAVEQLRDLVARRRAEKPETADSAQAHGYIELVRGATHGSLPSLALLRWHSEMRDHLRRHGLGDSHRSGDSPRSGKGDSHRKGDSLP